VILGWLSTLESGPAVRDLNSVLSVVRRNAELQAKLIDDLLDTNRLLSGNLLLEPGRVDLTGLIRTTLRDLTPAASRKGIELVALDATEPVFVAGDQRRLQQVLWNLVHNAVKFTPAGGTVSASLTSTGGDVEVTVRDSGRGIGAEFLPHIFERFRQETAATNDGTAGLGLGLAIARQLVELHRGTIRVSSDGPGQGATFVVRLPALSSSWTPGPGGRRDVAASEHP
jgi:signal transduction histidine kinase